MSCKAAPIPLAFDFEKTAINATERVLPTATVQGCAFHLAQARNRKRDKVGITHYLEGRTMEPLVVDWWDTIKGVIFLPRRLHREVRALTTPPVPEDHSAFAPCEGFLRYLKETWYDNEVFSDLWDKYGVEEVRTTNLAEAYHSELNTLMEDDHPSLSKLLSVVHDLDNEADSALIALEQNPDHVKHVRKEHLERRQRIAEEMRRFNALYKE
ncbi:hypothetical protein OESDEN_19226, partial [Oesophagostomum dentatum]